MPVIRNQAPRTGVMGIQKRKGPEVILVEHCPIYHPVDKDTSVSTWLLGTRTPEPVQSEVKSGLGHLGKFPKLMCVAFSASIKCVNILLPKLKIRLF